MVHRDRILPQPRWCSRFHFITACSVHRPVVRHDATISSRDEDFVRLNPQQFNAVAAASGFSVGFAFSYSSHTSFTPQIRILRAVIPLAPLKHLSVKPCFTLTVV